MMRSVQSKICVFYFLIFVFPFMGILSCGGSGGSSADLNLSAQNCGNALINESESCDDGNINNSDGCNAHCAFEVGEAICGNGVLENDECCDDGNTVSGDGCSSVCTSEKNNHAPSAPILADEPASGVTWAPTRLYLSWSPSTDSDAGDQVIYDVYFVDTNGISPNAVPYKKGVNNVHFVIQSSTDNRPEFFPDEVSPIYLESNHTYTWKVCARDKVGAQSCSVSRTLSTDHDDSLVGWWRFAPNDLSQDASGHGNTATLVGVSSHNDNNDHYADFDTFGDYGDVSVDGLTPMSGTILTWFKPNFDLLSNILNGANDDMVSILTIGRWWEYSLRILYSESSAYCPDNTFTDSICVELHGTRSVPEIPEPILGLGYKQVPSKNEWNFIAISWDQISPIHRLTFYSNLSSNQLEATIPFAFDFDPRMLRFGYSGASSESWPDWAFWYKGGMREVQLFDKVLNPIQLKQICNSFGNNLCQ